LVTKILHFVNWFKIRGSLFCHPYYTMKNKNFRVKGKMSDCGKTNFEFLFSHYSTFI